VRILECALVWRGVRQHSGGTPRWSDSNDNDDDDDAAAADGSDGPAGLEARTTGGADDDDDEHIWDAFGRCARGWFGPVQVDAASSWLQACLPRQETAAAAVAATPAKVYSQYRSSPQLGRRARVALSGSRAHDGGGNGSSSGGVGAGGTQLGSGEPLPWQANRDYTARTGLNLRAGPEHFTKPVCHWLPSL
jgi:hypothetical protein